MPLSPKEARWKFIRAVRMIIMQNSMNKATAEIEEEDQILSFVSHIAENGQPEELTFDKKYFRAKRETRITQEVKNVLSLEAEERRPDQLQKALKGLQSISSFAEYPLHIQEKLARVAYFYNIPEKKVIIRQGHIAENFYFLVTGNVSVTKTEADLITLEARTAEIGRFGKGDCFGELELLHGDIRPYTITAESPCQLIAIEKEDFFDMFMGDGEEGKEFEHLKFLRMLPFLKGWPVQKLNEHPQMCLVHFFKRSSVIIKDSNQSDWLYIVKSGSCQVIKQLRETQTTLPPQRNRRGSLATSSTPEKPAFTPRDGLHIGSKVDTRLRRASVSESSSITSYDDEDDDDRPLRRRKSSVQEEVKDSEKKVVFVQVDMLHSKDVFGLPMLCRESGITDINQPSLSLVSRGAECIMLNKKFFLKEASEFVHRHLKEIVRPYPLGETLQENLQQHTDWAHYKRQAVSDFLSSTNRKNSSTAAPFANNNVPRKKSTSQMDGPASSFGSSKSLSP